MSKVSSDAKYYKDNAIWRYVDILAKKYGFSSTQIRVNPAFSFKDGVISPDILVYAKTNKNTNPYL